ncbi:unnamed protein product [Bursaphelenchus okinawaensis]|uniref:Chitin-binding type-2 domain-containing protein n=1 Tax=Bursaphelenchus okinawaensis TaxID=465554 RepID=A0A811KJ92_9BILA|nr:unnamed protein product [Bursaphelenchus okinawaensis]CAG9103952.1 unnamed protein product [Bursaphelenchus okinawaensis]
MARLWTLAALNLIYCAVLTHSQSTPVIGGACKLGSADVNIGGKQTQFYLHCEVEDPSRDTGIWVVKTKGKPQETRTLPYAEPTVSLPYQQPPKKQEKLPLSPIVCEQIQAQESGYCNIPETCLQSNPEDQNSYLQCNPVTRKWTKKFCQQGFWFSFEHQSCVAHAFGGNKGLRQHSRKAPAPMHQYPSSGGLVCTYSQCSPSNPCSTGSCNNGYCCSAAGSGALMGVPVSSKPHRPTKNGIPEHTNRFSKHTNPHNLNINHELALHKPKPINKEFPRSIQELSKHDLPHSKHEISHSGNTVYHSLLTHPQNDWNENTLPAEFSALNSMLVKATGDGGKQRHYTQFLKVAASCAAGFTSTISCAGRAKCPPGLFCDNHILMCCPMLLPLKEVMPTTTSKPVTTTSKTHIVHHHYPRRLLSSDVKRPPHSYPDQHNSHMSNYHSFKRPNCPNGASPYGTCSRGTCATGYQCIPSTNLCCPTAAPIRTYSSCPAGSSGAGACVSGQCGPGYSCNSNNVCCAQVVPATVCPDGTQAAGACVNNMCGVGFTCNQGLCCTNTSQTPRCLDGSQAIGACMQGKCGSGYTCTTGNICCPSTLNSCPNGQQSIGTCVNGRCPDGYACINNQCCGPPPNNANSQATCVEADSNGPCGADGNCPEPGYLCDTANNWCCPQTMGSAVGPCIAGAGGTRLCPEGYACSGPGVGNCFRLNTGTCAPEDQFGPCGANNQCPPNYTCYGGFCCRNGTFRRKKRSSFLVDYFNN